MNCLSAQLFVAWNYVKGHNLSLLTFYFMCVRLTKRGNSKLLAPRGWKRSEIGLFFYFENCKKFYNSFFINNMILQNDSQKYSLKHYSTIKTFIFIIGYESELTVSPNAMNTAK